VETEQTSSTRTVPMNGQRWQHSLREMDVEEEAYFNTEENDPASPTPAKAITNGVSPIKPLVNYPDDEEEMELPKEESLTLNGNHGSEKLKIDLPHSSRDETPPPPERLSEKRRRAEEDEDELDKLSQPKRRSSIGSLASTTTNSDRAVEPPPTHTHMLRRKRKVSNINKEVTQKKIIVSLAVKSETTPARGNGET